MTSWVKWNDRAHPRSRGENAPLTSEPVSSLGSSPLTRGKQPGLAEGAPPAGLIPAHAGKTYCPPGRFAVSRAHPRSRGENIEIKPVRTVHAGSSPLTRGKLARVHRRARDGGLIPAHAGKTSSSTTSGGCATAHPRSRGENVIARSKSSGRGGSSPLTRGKHFLTCVFIAQIGQILESLELCASSESYSSQDAYATDALRGQVRSIDLGLRSSRDAS